MSNKKQLLNIPIYLLFIAFSFGILYICTASSPRYATNPWNDANAFLTMGRSMANGLTIYKDIFEQKGPLLYLLHAAACLISDSSFFGVYIIQSLSLSATAFAAYKIASLYVGTAWSVISAVLTCFVTVHPGGYYYGDRAEEFCHPVMMFSTYFFCRFFKKYTGATFSQYLAKYRVLQAEQLLAQTSKKISEIALETGFADEGSFIQCFRKYYGCTPRNYRKEITQNPFFRQD